MSVQPTIPQIEIRYATPADAEAIAALYTEVYDGGYPITECTDPTFVRRIVADQQHIWVLALHGDAVVGAGVARPNLPNASYELCRGVVHPDYRGRASYRELFALTLTDAFRRPDCDMIYGYARSEHSRRTFSRVAPVSWTGTDGGMHRVGQEREEHVLGVVFNLERSVTRIVPSLSILVPDSAVANEIAALNSITRATPGQYPSDVVASAATELTHESDRGRVSYSVSEPSRAAVVGAVEGDTPDDVRQVLWAMIDDAGPSAIEHVTLHVLADKIPIIAALCRPDPSRPPRRFAVRGYLPGWHEEAGIRYDCVTLTSRLDQQAPQRHGLDDLITAICQSFPPDLT